jgi:hypothetical protein
MTKEEAYEHLTKIYSQASRALLYVFYGMV